MQHATAKSAVESRPMPAPGLAKGVLLPGFTAVNNAYYLDIQNRLTLAELRLLNVIIYFTNGYLRRWCIIGEEALCRHANIARSTLYDTKKSLEAQGLIKICRSRFACRYSLGDRLGVLADDTQSAPSTPLKSALVDPNPSGSVDPCLEAQDNYDQQQAPQTPESSEPVDDALLEIVRELEREWTAPGMTEATPGVSKVAPDNDQSQQLADTAANTGRLVAQLIEQGVHHRVAVRLVNTQTPEVIASAIARLPKVPTTNPAGYLVAEISRGGYKEPDRTKPLRVYHDEIHRARQAERDQDAEAKEQSSRQIGSAMDRFALLPPEHQADLIAALNRQAHAEGFTRLRGWGEEHPVYRGLLAKLVAPG